MNKEIISINYKREFHGYQEWYSKDKLYFRGEFKNDNKIGYTESFETTRTRYYIK